MYVSRHRQNTQVRDREHETAHERRKRRPRHKVHSHFLTTRKGARDVRGDRSRGRRTKTLADGRPEENIPRPFRSENERGAGRGVAPLRRGRRRRDRANGMESYVLLYKRRRREGGSLAPSFSRDAPAAAALLSRVPIRPSRSHRRAVARDAPAGDCATTPLLVAKATDGPFARRRPLSPPLPRAPRRWWLARGIFAVALT